MAKRGRPALIDLSELEKLASMMATDEEIADWFGVDVRTVERRKKEPAFAEAMQRGRSRGKISIRRAQLKLIEEGSAPMAIFWGKNYLGQTDGLRHDIVAHPLLNLVLPRRISPSDYPATATTQPLIEAGESEEVVDVQPANDTLKKD